MITTWYLQSQRTWDKLCHSCIGSSFLPPGAFPEGRAYAFPQRLHAGSLEALRVSRPEAVVLAINNEDIKMRAVNAARASVPAILAHLALSDRLAAVEARLDEYERAAQPGPAGANGRAR